MEELDVEAFRRWLEAHCSDEVGIAYAPDACPVARWLSEERGCPWWVGSYYYGGGFYDPDRSAAMSFHLPPWGRAFVSRFDYVFDGRGMVTGAQALAVLNEVAP